MSVAGDSVTMTDNGIAIALPYKDMFSAVVTAGPTVADIVNAVPMVGGAHRPRTDIQTLYVAETTPGESGLSGPTRNGLRVRWH